MKLDFHSHILPGLDDGAKSLTDSIELVKALESWGFERVTCTPHITSAHPNTPDRIQQAFERLSEALATDGCNIELRMSAEYRLVPETWPEVLEKNWLMPIEDKFILMELPISKPKELGYIKPMHEFYRIMAMGLTPLLPHPERYFYLKQDELLRYIDAGVEIQSNYGSLAGVYGEDVQKRAENLLSRGLSTHFGTDLHNIHYVKILSQWFNSGHKIIESI
jgi:tyrosine-protein phosphatase YwqE